MIQQLNSRRVGFQNHLNGFERANDIVKMHDRQCGPFREWLRAIKGTGPEPGSHFGYASKLTEISLLGVLAQIGLAVDVVTAILIGERRSSGHGVDLEKLRIQSFS